MVMGNAGFIPSAVSIENCTWEERAAPCASPFLCLTPNGLCLRSIGFRAWGGIELRFPVYLGFHGAVSRALGSGFVNVLKGSCRVKNKYWGRLVFLDR